MWHIYYEHVLGKLGSNQQFIKVFLSILLHIATQKQNKFWKGSEPTSTLLISNHVNNYCDQLKLSTSIFCGGKNDSLI